MLGISFDHSDILMVIDKSRRSPKYFMFSIKSGRDRIYEDVSYIFFNGEGGYIMESNFRTSGE